METTETGPTGTQESQGDVGATELTGAELLAYKMTITPLVTIPEPTDTGASLAFTSGPTGFVDPTGPTEPPTIVTMEELLASHAAVVAQEAADTVTLTCLSAPTREGYRTHLFQWAALGFPDLYIIQSVSVTPPSICADGVTREIGKYAEYRMGKDLGAVVTSLSELMTGIRPSWSVSGNTLRIHVTRG